MVPPPHYSSSTQIDARLNAPSAPPTTHVQPQKPHVENGHGPGGRDGPASAAAAASIAVLVSHGEPRSEGRETPFFFSSSRRRRR
mmetsp:Transcript_897/g.1724  ORF Transcript_897/g.1724 Transcript_897/m.1724 type:complete len:85 (-) Transcript_897:1049-1303(-)